MTREAKILTCFLLAVTVSALAQNSRQRIGAYVPSYAPRRAPVVRQVTFVDPFREIGGKKCDLRQQMTWDATYGASGQRMPAWRSEHMYVDKIENSLVVLRDRKNGFVVAALTNYPYIKYRKDEDYISFLAVERPPVRLNNGQTVTLYV